MSKPNLMERVDILVGEHGKKWKDIILILEQEGYAESGQLLNTNAIRKRYDRWIKAEKKMLPPVEEAKRHAEKAEAAKTQRPPLPRTDDKSAVMVSAKEVLELLKGSMERRDSMLAQQLTKEHDKEYDAEREQRMEDRLTEKTGAQVEALVPEKVNSALQELLEEGGSLQRDIEVLVSHLVEAKVSDGLSALLSGIEIKQKSAGPGRGHKGSTVTKFSATIPEELYDAMKGMGGMFSSHLAAACELYLRARKKHPTQVSKEKETEASTHTD
jgi:hypothetical protein